MTPMLAPDAPNPTSRLRNAPVLARLMYRTAALPNGCWEWRGSANPRGYGHIRLDMNGRIYAVHRVAYEQLVGPIPAGLEIDHLCFNRRCVNPDHLEPVTRLENVRRGRTNQNDGKTHCKRGHEFDAANTSIDVLGKRVCKACARERQRTYRRAS
jgi:hypothetical protein